MKNSRTFSTLIVALSAIIASASANAEQRLDREFDRLVKLASGGTDDKVDKDAPQFIRLVSHDLVDTQVEHVGDLDTDRNIRQVQRLVIEPDVVVRSVESEPVVRIVGPRPELTQTDADEFQGDEEVFTVEVAPEPDGAARSRARTVAAKNSGTPFAIIRKGTKTKTPA